MTLSKTEEQMLFSLGKCIEQLAKRVKGKPLKVTVSKIGFIELLLASKAVPKKERAMYKNLEQLEKKGVFRYEQSRIKLTAKGKKYYTNLTKVYDAFNKLDLYLEKATVKRKLQSVLKK